MLSKDELEFQAEAFQGFAGKSENRDVPIGHVFAVWARSKDFFSKDARAIWHLVRERRPSLAPVEGE